MTRDPELRLPGMTLRAWLWAVGIVAAVVGYWVWCWTTR
jgi:hypothetical protein